MERWLAIVLLVAAVLMGTSAGSSQNPATPPPAADAHTPVGLWVTVARIRALPTTGPAWERVLAAAVAPTAHPDLQDGNQATNVQALAKALVYVRTGERHFRDEVIELCLQAIGTEDGHRPGRRRGWRSVRSLGPSRELAAYVIAADLVGLPPDADGRFRGWLRRLLTLNLGGRSIRSTHTDRPNNWGTHAGAARIAVAAYLGDREELAAAAAVFRGFLGDRGSHAKFQFGRLDWQADADRPVGINPRGARHGAHSIDGVLPDDQRRSEVAGGAFHWPPPRENYVYEALQGVLAQAVMLDRAGYHDVWEWQDRAILRAYRWLYETCRFPAEGDDTWQMPLVDHHYGETYWDGEPTRPGKNVGWTCWTHGAT